jgi:hypothetical protein
MLEGTVVYQHGAVITGAIVKFPDLYEFQRLSETGNLSLPDWRQRRSWSIDAAKLRPGSIVLSKSFPFGNCKSGASLAHHFHHRGALIVWLLLNQLSESKLKGKRAFGRVGRRNIAA